MLARILLVLAGSLLLGHSTSAEMTLIGKSDGKTFYSTKVEMNWYQAKDYCQEYGYQLASIQSQKEEDVIEQLAHKKTEAIEWSAFWLDGSYSSSSDQWTWVTAGGPLTFSNWQDGIAPNAMNSMMYGSYCLYVKLGKYNGTWAGNQCEYPIGSVHPLCMLEDKSNVPSDDTNVPDDNDSFPSDNTKDTTYDDSQSSATDVADATTAAPEPITEAIPVDLTNMDFIGTSEFEGTSKTFYYQNNYVTWFQAKEICHSHGMKFATIESEADGDILRKWFAVYNWYYYMWLAGTDNGGQEWTWVDSGKRIPFAGEGGPGYEEWGYNTPTNYTDDHDPQCLTVLSGSNWNNGMSCSSLSSVMPMCMVEKTLDTVPEPAVEDLPVDLSDLEFMGLSDSEGYSKQFFLYRRGGSWYDGKEACRLRGLKMASIETQVEADLLEQWTVRNNFNGFWAAGVDNGRSRWTWDVKGETVPLIGDSGYQDWGRDQPYINIYRHNYECLYVISGVYWWTFPCTQPDIPTICMLKE